MTPSLKKWVYRFLWLLLLAGLLTWALHKAPLLEIWSAIRGLRLWQAAVILDVNTLLFSLFSLRWWIIVKADAKGVPFLPLLGMRLSAFGLSYFTLGPQVGGEPLQVLSLQKKYGITYTRATASVFLDKILEFQVNFLMFALGLIAILQAGLLSGSRMQFIAVFALVAALVLVPVVHLTLLYHRRYPLAVLLGLLPFIPKKSRPVRFLRAAEGMAGRFCQRHLRVLLGALGVSLIAGAGLLVDYTLMISFLGINLPFWKMLAGWTAGWLAFLVPLPGGLGALESSQVFALGIFGIPAAVALGVVLLMRARDLVFGGLGLTLAGLDLSPKKNHKQNLGNGCCAGYPAALATPTYSILSIVSYRKGAENESDLETYWHHPGGAGHSQPAFVFRFCALSAASNEPGPSLHLEWPGVHRPAGRLYPAHSILPETP